MDILSLDSQDDFNHFMDSIKKNKDILIDEWYTMGAVSTSLGTKNNWYFINGGGRINFDIKWAETQPDGATNQLCLTMFKYRNDFWFHDTGCGLQTTVFSVRKQASKIQNYQTP
jgi:hypothetical protein